MKSPNSVIGKKKQYCTSCSARVHLMASVLKIWRYCNKSLSATIH